MTILIILKTAEVIINALALEFVVMILVVIIIDKFTKLVIKISFLYTAYKIGIAVCISLVPYLIIMGSHILIYLHVGIQIKDIGMIMLPFFTIFGLLVAYCIFMENHMIDIIKHIEEQEKIHIQSIESIAEDKKARMYFYDRVTHTIKKMKNIDEYNRSLVITDRFIINHKTKEIIGVGTDGR